MTTTAQTYTDAASRLGLGAVVITISSQRLEAGPLLLSERFLYGVSKEIGNTLIHF
jgi:hypothetical protein